ncbi:hypothetical protein AB0D45_20060 [Streptomyces sp. NPDC048352]|uniref:hypothetical protein n=1 Tax=Streptomyces sp. NPDC048352 TaxID=3154718 RepID=UPI00342BEB78
MGGMKDKRQEPGKGREEQKRPQPSGQDPVHPEPLTPSRGQDIVEKGRRRAAERRGEEHDLSDDDF